ncbi:MAG: 2-amino-4-hydroxy-6-hydroxymethyldihydropteridine diphosphokinase [Bacteroidia bacterium]
MNKIYLLIGGNLGDRKKNISQAENILSKALGKIIFSSAIYETAPWGFQHENYFLNKAICIETRFDAKKVLEICLQTEEKLGRKRTDGNYAARTMDIDILFFNDELIETEHLTIPHPQLHKRKFVLAPLAEIASNLEHPVFQKRISVLLHECSDILEVRKL